MATTSGSRTKNRSASRPASRKPLTTQKDEDKKTVRKRVFGYLLVIGLMFAAFYGYQYVQMSNVRASLDRQIIDVEKSNAADKIALTETMEKIKKTYPAADKFSADAAFSKAPLAGRLEMRTNQIISEGEAEIKRTRERTPFIFITDVIMPGAQQSTDDHYRDSLRTHVASADFVSFNRTKLQVDDLMSGIRFCQGTKTDLFYGYTDPVPDEATKQSRAAAIQGAAKRHLCP